VAPGIQMRMNPGRDFKKFDAYCLGNKEMGETMNIEIRRPAMYPVSRRASAVQDFLMVSAFGIWALVLGLSPVLVFHALT
jgi:hypothetical protein